MRVRSAELNDLLGQIERLRRGIRRRRLSFGKFKGSYWPIAAPSEFVHDMGALELPLLGEQDGLLLGKTALSQGLGDEPTYKQAPPCDGEPSNREKGQCGAARIRFAGLQGESHYRQDKEREEPDFARFAHLLPCRAKGLGLIGSTRRHDGGKVNGGQGPDAEEDFDRTELENTTR